jgi:hypothetical protein
MFSGKLDFATADAGYDQAMLIFQAPPQFVVGVVGEIQKIPVGAFEFMNDSAACVDRGVDARVFARLGLDMVHHAIVVDIGVKPHHHGFFPATC